MNAVLKDGKLIVTLDVNETPVVSKSGKSRIVASTNGNVQTALQVDGQNVTIGLNAYIPKK